MTDISVVVPVLNEEKAILPLLVHLKGLGMEIVVSDGGSRDRTRALAESMADRVVVGSPGRSRQMNLGAKAASGGILFFVHADSFPPPSAPDVIRRTLAGPGVAAGAFRLRIETRRLGLRLIHRLANFRAKAFKLPYGDQGLFLTRRVFDAVGGFTDLPLMEDVDLVRRVKALGRVIIARESMTTSARRWERDGILATTLRNQRRLLRFFLGSPARRLARDYPDVR
jgi:rSAM/selenodomain-associated transferase 2